MMITNDELRTIALGVVSDNQSEFAQEDTRSDLKYRLGYNDGVIDLLNAILEKKGDAL